MIMEFNRDGRNINRGHDKNEERIRGRLHELAVKFLSAMHYEMIAEALGIDFDRSKDLVTDINPNEELKRRTEYRRKLFDDFIDLILKGDPSVDYVLSFFKNNIPSFDYESVINPPKKFIEGTHFKINHYTNPPIVHLEIPGIGLLIKYINESATVDFNLIVELQKQLKLLGVYIEISSQQTPSYNLDEIISGTNRRGDLSAFIKAMREVAPSIDLSELEIQS